MTVLDLVQSSPVDTPIVGMPALMGGTSQSPQVLGPGAGFRVLNTSRITRCWVLREQPRQHSSRGEAGGCLLSAGPSGRIHTEYLRVLLVVRDAGKVSRWVFEI